MLKNIVTAIALAASALAATPTYAMTYFLVSEWYESGNHFCRYGNGTVLNVGYRTCPLNIQG